MQKIDRNLIFSKNLKYLREKLELSQVQLAQKLNVSRGTIGNYETGMEPQKNLLKELALFFNVGIDELLHQSLSADDTLLNIVSEDEHHYGNNIILPVVSRVSADKYNIQDEIRRELCNKVDFKPSWFFLRMPDDSLMVLGKKSIKEGDLLLIDPEIKDIYPGDLVAVVTRSGRQWIKYVENYENGILYLQGGIKLSDEETAGKYRIIRVRPGEFEV